MSCGDGDGVAAQHSRDGLDTYKERNDSIKKLDYK